MEITATELKKNLGKYLGAITREDVVITKNGKAVARIISERDYRAGAAELDKLLLLREQPAGDLYAPEAGSAASAGIMPGLPGGLDLDAGEWALTHNGEPVARLTPIPKKKKRQLGFIKGPPATPEEEAALFESEWTEEIEREWLSKL
ncbi:MAG: type II toxin-antitoxin system Phd/YefM family antitoxin [Clostridiales Family XIII bacterium]|jgi:prevent-host-death family protein|nr:type II toxin-antitoxin system Phd/YefM family antitoxin [Clostridiales Family XIII bacterium]